MTQKRSIHSVAKVLSYNSSQSLRFGALQHLQAGRFLLSCASMSLLCTLYELRPVYETAWSHTGCAFRVERLRILCSIGTGENLMNISMVTLHACVFCSKSPSVRTPANMNSLTGSNGVSSGLVARESAAEAHSTPAAKGQKPSDSLTHASEDP